MRPAPAGADPGRSPDPEGICPPTWGWWSSPWPSTRVFDTSRDRLVFDVGHQSYPHKMLTGRREQMSTIRQLGGIAASPSHLRASMTHSSPDTPPTRWRWRWGWPGPGTCWGRTTGCWLSSETERSPRDWPMRACPPRGRAGASCWSPQRQRHVHHQERGQGVAEHLPASA